ncbi:hypothetical protein [Qipengyuania sphaerica]|uniref:hypothetical protein n=1 Tax=Qipengyuania sphaerica TaxID=2867243 RepID=UPI001C883588|nr:hypothetical protein [Qipengyuania sphaerica]MBX7540176.1 hypothetical protein [Qipengyuania sphaerica]
MLRSIPLMLAGMLAASCQHQAPGAQIASSNEPEQAPVYVIAICGDCHAVTADSLSPNPQAPGFADIANSPGVTHETLVAFLSDAHNYPLQMDVDLDEEDIATIADHIMTLQSDDYHRTPS